MRRQSDRAQLRGCPKSYQNIAELIPLAVELVLGADLFYLGADSMLVVRRDRMAQQAPRELAKAFWSHVEVGMVYRIRPCPQGRFSICQYLSRSFHIATISFANAKAIR